jgi:hypothetical protein
MAETKYAFVAPPQNFWLNLVSSFATQPVAVFTELMKEDEASRAWNAATFSQLILLSHQSVNARSACKYMFSNNQ